VALGVDGADRVAVIGGGGFEDGVEGVVEGLGGGGFVGVWMLEVGDVRDGKRIHGLFLLAWRNVNDVTSFMRIYLFIPIWGFISNIPFQKMLQYA
jgi:hypothetical protein